MSATDWQKLLGRGIFWITLFVCFIQVCTTLLGVTNWWLHHPLCGLYSRGCIMKEDGKWRISNRLCCNFFSFFFIVLLPILWSRGLEFLLKFSKDSVTYPSHRGKRLGKFSSLLKTPSWLLPGPVAVSEGSLEQGQVPSVWFQCITFRNLPLSILTLYEIHFRSRTGKFLFPSLDLLLIF